MFWGNQSPKEPDSAPLDADKRSPRAKLPAELQEMVDRDEFYDDLYSPYSIDSTESPVRYAAYAQRIRTILLSAHRYVAYTSDIGESFRPVAHPWLVRSAYGISWAYLLGDVGHEGYKAYLRNRCALIPPGDAHKDASNVTSEEVIRGMAMGNIRGPLSKEAQVARERDSLTPWPETQISLAEDYRMVMAKRAVFQSIASMGLPAFTIHSVVRYSGRAVKNAKNPLFRTWFPIGLGLAVVPFLPYLFDHPVEEAVDWAFGTGLRMYGGEDAVRPLPSHALPSPPASQQSEGISTAAQLSWEQHKEEREKARELRREIHREEHGTSGSLFSWFSGSSADKPKKD
ncbi:hypothetical protein POX_b02251 [Penicillium oxalicum]|uniref:Mitochondrial fission process protein 1 n=1 Tax=Penicillium oxalicum (strain 114-2 / CGMCC 5302) TaxID=933388 RepID=S7ZQ30_PENO1|nr:hypothetical protein POX_b02251 [Penicillium oxalicum]EPS30746.1 hypothetical protein PDE_05698 [Penicillium oxalicum 114-2]KAI2792214.1 hypothetical protein POX_b02251 [Penicillium oxalicum]